MLAPSEHHSQNWNQLLPKAEPTKLMLRVSDTCAMNLRFPRPLLDRDDIDIPVAPTISGRKAGRRSLEAPIRCGEPQRRPWLGQLHLSAKHDERKEQDRPL